MMEKSDPSKEITYIMDVSYIHVKENISQRLKLY
jgi:hypothetical protein